VRERPPRLRRARRGSNRGRRDFHFVVPHYLDDRSVQAGRSGAAAASTVHRDNRAGTVTAARVLDRFIRYVRYDTRSDESSTTYPSTSNQLILLRDLAEELRGMGAADAGIDDAG